MDIKVKVCKIFQGSLLPVIILGALFSLGFAATHGLRSYFILYECNISTSTNHFYSYFEEGTYTGIDFLRIGSYIIFIWDSKGYFIYSNKLHLISWNKKGSLVAILSTCTVVSLLSIPAAFVGHARDKKYIDGCDNETENLRNTIIIDAHATFKCIVLLSTIIVSLCAANILHSSSTKWEKDILTESEEDWNVQREDLRRIVDNKFYHLYNDYIAIGKSANPECTAVRRWFVVMYFIYFIFILVRLVHIMKTLSGTSPHEKYLDMIHTILNITMHFFAFFIPYYSASRLNKAHHDYYTKMSDTYLGVVIVLDSSTSSNDQQSVTCKPGKDFKREDFKRVGLGPKDMVDSDQRDNEHRHLLHKQQDKLEIGDVLREDIEEKYKQYYLAAIKNRMRKVDEFDFVPSFSNISIPLDSQGYTFTIILLIVSVVFNFV